MVEGHENTPAGLLDRLRGVLTETAPDDAELRRLEAEDQLQRAEIASQLDDQIVKALVERVQADSAALEKSSSLNNWIAGYVMFFLTALSGGFAYLVYMAMVSSNYTITPPLAYVIVAVCGLTYGVIRHLVLHLSR